ncbi:methyltransferase domain protein [Colletotrichum karsti]|uniref:Methyltransferase domain protein n=1 Tax=Colletotrichum karsti TaxID=1095194 RepID=A0A9P6I706_9PEZI|nr:methyltransferase domain protein [Colletotrichum karsti]KAF9875151.1 methyltransferase domain protein [Colletotrichum karsti]
MTNTNYKTVYSPSFLTLFYDKYVLGFNMRYMWGCPTDDILLPFFSENFSRNHLDVGVATGYFPAVALARPFRTNSKQRLTLVDLTAPPLNATKTRVLSVTSATEVNCVEADVTEPPPKALLGERYDSISMFNLFHCMPGGKGKLRAFGTYKELLSEDGVLSGCTVLGPRESTGFLTKFYLRWYNKWWGVFNNWDDNEEDIREALDQEFEEVETWVIGNTMLFRAKKPRKALLDV